MLGHAELSTNAICAVGRAAEWCAASKCQMLSGLDAAQLKLCALTMARPVSSFGYNDNMSVVTVTCLLCHHFVELAHSLF